MELSEKVGMAWIECNWIQIYMSPAFVKVPLAKSIQLNYQVHPAPQALYSPEAAEFARDPEYPSPPTPDSLVSQNN
jgi:hypothetical protein